jgi:dTDP-4-dehydrorhamnose 3,5-epimerase-like enzyme
MLAGPMSFAHVNDVRTIELPRFGRADGELVIAEGASTVPFAIERVFTLRAPLGARRGEHAHRRCTQLLVCVHGCVEIMSDDSRNTQTVTLDRAHLGLLVPPTIWNCITFRQDNSVLLVMCDRHFQEDDYIRVYSDFLVYRKAGAAE